MKTHKTRRNSLRLQGYDYATPGAYFITICCKDKQPFFGPIHNGRLRMSEIGKIAARAWLQTEKMWTKVQVDTWVLMPNHVHALLWFTNESGHLPYFPPEPYWPQTPGYINQLKSPSANLGSMVRGFKGSVTREARLQGYVEFQWQRSFHDRIVRNQAEFELIREYIIANPSNWREDEWYLW